MARLLLTWPPRQTGILSGVVIAALGLLVASWLCLARAGLLQTLAEHQQQLAIIEHHLRMQQVSPVSTPDTTEISTAQAINRIARELTFPWLTLRERLQQLTPTGIRLDVLEPDPHNGQIQLEGHALNTRVFLDFVQHLRQQPDYLSVQPLSEDIDTTQPDTPTRFRLSLQWVAR